MAAAEQFLTFEVAGKALAIPTAQVAEVVSTPQMTRVPQSPASLKGLSNLRGRITPIVSLSALMGADRDTPASRVIVLDRQDPVGLAVDRILAMETAQGAATTDVGGAGSTPVIELEALLAKAFSALPSRLDADRRTHASSPTEEPEAEQLAFLQFELAGQVYALPLAQVREVVAPPEDLTVLPQREQLMLGVMSLRSAVLGLVSLGALLGLKATAMTARSRVVVATLGTASVGLLVDHVRSILRAPQSAVVEVPAILNRGAGEARIDAIVRSPSGLVSVLSAEKIFLDSTVAEIAARGAADRSSSAVEDEGAGLMEKFVIFRLGSETFGLPVASVSEIVRLPATVTRAPRAPAFIAGVMNHRGKVVPLIDQRARFETRGDEGRARRVIIASIDGLSAGFIVDAVEEILAAPAEALQAAPGLVSAETPVFDRVATFEHDGRLILLMDPRRLLDQAERDVVQGLMSQNPSAPT